MDYLMQKLGYLFPIMKRDNTEEMKNCYTRLDHYLGFAYSILSWKHPTLTWIAFLLLNFIYWCVVVLELRPLGIVFLSLLFLFNYDCYLTQQGKYPPADRFSTEQCQQLWCKGFAQIELARKYRPAQFCAATSGAFAVLGVVGRRLTGPQAAYCLLLMLFFAPLAVSRLPPEITDHILKIITVKPQDSVKSILAEDDLLPEKDGDSDAERESVLTDKTLDSVCGSIASGLGSLMPSHLDTEEVPKEIEEEDLLPGNAPERLSSSDTDSEDLSLDDSLYSSSSEEERLLSEGLHFTAHERTPEPGASGVLLNAVGKVMSKAFGGYKAPVKRDSSSESDFEIINYDQSENK